MSKNDKIPILTHLLRDGATLEAKKQLLTQAIPIMKNFEKYDQYIQGVLIQSAINLSESEFRQISKEYFQIIEIAKNSPDEWIQKIAYEYSEFPKIKIDEDLNETFDTSPLESLLSRSSTHTQDQSNFLFDEGPQDHLDPSITPPSSHHKLPVISQKVQEFTQQKAATENVLTIPSALKAKPPPIQQPKRRQDTPIKNYLPPEEKKKGKKMKDFSELPDFLLMGPKKKK